MTIEQFARWCHFFREQLVRPGEASEWLEDWFDDLKDHHYEDALEAVRHVRKNLTRWDVAQRCLNKILAFLDNLESLRGSRGRRQLAALCESGKTKAVLPDDFSYAACAEHILERRRQGDERPANELREEYMQTLGKKRRRTKS